MKKLLLSMVIALAGLSANAGSEGTVCTMEFDVKTDMNWGVIKGAGQGTIYCAGVTGETQHKVNISVDGRGLGWGQTRMRGGSVEFGVSDIQQVAGVYNSLGVNLLVGGANLGFSHKQNGLQLKFNLHTGAGLNVSVMEWTFTLLEPDQGETL